MLVFISCAFLAYCYFGGYRLKWITTNWPRVIGVDRRHHRQPPHNADGGGLLDTTSTTTAIPLKFLLLFSGGTHRHPATDPHHLLSYSDPVRNATITQLELDSHAMAAEEAAAPKSLRPGQEACRMETCFDYGRCLKEFRVYVYPLEPLNSLGAAPPISPNYQKIIAAIVESRYYTAEPERACLFVLGIDTLDRDSLSDDYVRNVPARVQRLPHWNNGRNHIIFNLYSGTWPDYVENSLGFDTGEAILAKASMSEQHIRPGFDVSIPLFHKQFPLRAGNTGSVTSNNFPANKKYLLAFKGKR